MNLKAEITLFTPVYQRIRSTIANNLVNGRMEWKILPSTIKYSYENIEKKLLEYIKYFFFFFFFISRNALFKGAVLLVATELDKEEQCNATEGRGYANENGWFDRYSNQSLTTNGIRYLLYLRFSLCCGYVTSFCDFTWLNMNERYLIFDSLIVRLNYEKFKIRNYSFIIKIFLTFLALTLILFFFFSELSIKYDLEEKIKKFRAFLLPKIDQ